MTNWRVQVTIGHKNGRPEDAFVNDFAIIDPTDSIVADGGPLNVTTCLDHFYNTQRTVAGFNRAITDYMAEAASRAALGVTLKYFDITGKLDGSPTGSPDFTDAFTLAANAPGGANLPSEVAACLTVRGSGWQGAAVNVPAGAPGPAGDQRPRQRHSGRIFIGPLTALAVSTDATTGIVRLDSVFRGHLIAASEALADELSTAGAGFSWGQWSRKDTAMVPVQHVEVDDAPDTIRKRGQAATVRDRSIDLTV